MLEKLFRSRHSKAKLFGYIDCLFPKNKKKVLFVVKDRTHFSGNLRIVLETYLEKSDKRLCVYKDGKYSDETIKELKSYGVIVLTGFRLHSIWHILTSGIIILSHNPRDAHLTKKCKKRHIINLWHGVAFKTIELLMPNIDKDKLALIKKNSQLYDMVIASSKQDKTTNAKAFGVDLDKIQITGLPRYEILRKGYILGKSLRCEDNKIRQVKGDRKLVLYAPTFRESTESIIKKISTNEWKKLESFADQSNILFGVRPHPYDIKYLPEVIKNSNNFYLFDNIKFTEVNLLLKHVDILVVDFSSIWIDYLLLKKPIVGFAKDYKWYNEHERGFIYDFDSTFPTKFTEDIDKLIETLNSLLDDYYTVNYEYALNKFHRYTLDNNYKDMIYAAIDNTTK